MNGNNPGDKFDFSKIHGKIVSAQTKTNEELGKASDIPSPINLGSNLDTSKVIPGVDKIDPKTHGAPDQFLTKDEQKSKILAIDIETYRNVDLNEAYKEYKLGILADKRAKDPAKIEASKLKKHNEAATNPMLGRIILTGLSVNSQPITENWAMVTDSVYYEGLTAFDETEKIMLENFWVEFGKYINAGYTLLTFNGKGFDLPYLVFRSLVNDVNFAGALSPFGMLSNYRHDVHCDLMTLFPKELTGNRPLGLNEMAYLFGFNEIDFKSEGSKIEGWFEKREFETIIKKNMWDLALTMKLHEKVRKFL